MFKDYGTAAIYKIKIIQLFYLITGLGHQAVIVFFVLSGYLISGSVLKKTEAGKFNFRQYLIDRVSRIYTVLVIALLITVVLDRLGNALDINGIYAHKVHFVALNYSVNERSGFIYFVTSLFMLQNIVCPPLGSNSPLWSLNYEFFYYLLFPCLCIPVLSFFNKRQKTPAIWLYITAGLSLIFLLPAEISSYFLLWLLGMLPVFLNIRLTLVKYLLPVLLIGFLIGGKMYHIEMPAFYYDFITGILFSFWLCCFDDIKKEGAFYKYNKHLASFSYTLYLVHFPFILFCITVMRYCAIIKENMDPSVGLFGLFIIVLVLSYLFSYFVATFTEFKTTKVKRYLEGFL
jgi:peptidoglycan/LPS O-acetylase OafA/YrhL